MRQSRIWCRCRHAFTLVELLTVIGIIGILAALLFPAFRAARAQAAKATCLSSLRQTGTAIALYVQDYDGYLPYAPDPNTKALVLLGVPIFDNPLNDEVKTLPDIKAVLVPYNAVNTLFRCPSDNRTLQAAHFPAPKPTWFETSGSSYFYIDRIALQVTPIASFNEPANSYVMGDFECFHDAQEDTCGFFNVLQVDFHVKSLTAEQRETALNNAYSALPDQ